MSFIKTFKRKLSNISEIFSTKNYISNENIIVTGANSGIGFQLVNILKDHKNNILAFVNNDDENTKSLQNDKIKILRCDFSIPANINNYSRDIINFKPTILINCAASFGPNNQLIESFLTNEFNSILNINVLSPIILINNSLRSNSLKQIINISSTMGSISKSNGNYYLYRSSKTLLNSVTKNLSYELKNKKVSIFCLHPGDVKTKMNSGGLISSKSAAQKIINICFLNKSTFHGKFIDSDGKILSW